jgi:hypothetical protein
LSHAFKSPLDRKPLTAPVDCEGMVAEAVVAAPICRPCPVRFTVVNVLGTVPEIARNAQRPFAKQEPREKRRLLNFVLSNCTWEDGEAVATFRQPFDMLAENVHLQTACGQAMMWSTGFASEE